MFTVKEQNNGEWTIGVKKGRKFVKISDTTYSKKYNAERGLKTLLEREMKNLNKSKKRGRPSTK